MKIIICLLVQLLAVQAFARINFGVVPPDAPTPGVLTLTFDDGPSRELTPVVLQTLAKHKILATFFVLGRNAEAHPDLIQAIRKAGHTIGSHSWRHPDFRRIGVAQTQAEILRTEQVLLHQLGGVWDRKYFRYPFGEDTSLGNRFLQSQGYGRSVGWHIDTRDWSQKGRADFANHVIADILQKRGGIVLFHDVQSKTAQNLDQIISALKARGFRFTNLDDEKVYPLLNEGKAPTAVSQSAPQRIFKK